MALMRYSLSLEDMAFLAFETIHLLNQAELVSMALSKAFTFHKCKQPNDYLAIRFIEEEEAPAYSP